MDNDRNFKELLTTFFADFFDVFRPDVAQYMERDSLELLNEELFTDMASGKRHELNLIVKVRFQAWKFIEISASASAILI